MTLQLTLIDSAITIVVDADERAHWNGQHQVAALLAKVQRALLVLHEMRGEWWRKRQRQEGSQRELRSTTPCWTPQ
jgi:hypothetical protein